MKNVLKLNDVKGVVEKMKHLTSFCRYTKGYESLENRLGIMLVGKLNNEAAEWVKKQKCYYKEVNGITFISLDKENLPEDLKLIE